MTNKSTIIPAEVQPKPAVATRRKDVAIKPVVAQAAAAKKASDKPTKKSKKTKKSGAKIEKKVKVVRDSFTMPQDDYAKIDDLKQTCLTAGLHVKKSELLRAGLHTLSALSAAQLKQAMGKLDTIKTGRPKKPAA